MPRGLAAELHMSISAVYNWIHRGWVIAECDDFWKINADAAELERLRELRAGPPGYSGRQAGPQSVGPGMRQGTSTSETETAAGS